MLSISGHKIHGPKGIDALYIRKGVNLAPLIHGGGQERGLRSATENVAGIVGLGAAAKIAAAQMAQESSRLRQLRDRLIAETMRRVPNAYLLGHLPQRLPGNICLGFAGQENEAIKVLLALDEAVSRCRREAPGARTMPDNLRPRFLPWAWMRCAPAARCESPWAASTQAKKWITFSIFSPISSMRFDP